MTTAQSFCPVQPARDDVYENYVLYKVAPGVDDLRAQLLQLATTAPLTAEGQGDLHRAVFDLGRASALLGGLALGSAIRRAMLGGDMDATFADAYLFGYFILTDAFKAQVPVRVALSTEFRRMFTRDIDYLCLSPDREIRHLQRRAWPAMVRVRDDLPSLREADAYAALLGRIAAARAVGNWHPYDDIDTRPALSTAQQDRFDLEFSTLRAQGYRPYGLWSETLAEADHTLRQRGSRVWDMGR